MHSRYRCQTAAACHPSQQTFMDTARSEQVSLVIRLIRFCREGRKCTLGGSISGGNLWSLIAWLAGPDGLLPVGDSRRGAGRTVCRRRTVAAARDPSCHRHGCHDGSGPIAGTGPTIPVQVRSISMRFTGYSFGSVRVDGVTYDHDLIIDRGKIRKRKKTASKRFRGAYGHTPLSIAEDIPWRCRRLVIGTGADGALPVMTQVQEEARRRKVDLVVLPTAEAIDVLNQLGRHRPFALAATWETATRSSLTSIKAETEHLSRRRLARILI